MYHINGQTVLEEKYDENYEPTEEGAYYVLCQLTVSYRTVLSNYYKNVVPRQGWGI